MWNSTCLERWYLCIWNQLEWRHYSVWLQFPEWTAVPCVATSSRVYHLPVLCAFFQSNFVRIRLNLDRSDDTLKPKLKLLQMTTIYREKQLITFTLTRLTIDFWWPLHRVCLRCIEKFNDKNKTGNNKSDFRVHFCHRDAAFMQTVCATLKIIAFYFRRLNSCIALGHFLLDSFMFWQALFYSNQEKQKWVLFWRWQITFSFCFVCFAIFFHKVLFQFPLFH